MARSIWTGTIAFGLVNIPIKMYPAVSESNLDLDMLDKKDKNHIRYKRVNEKTGKEVSWDNIVKGYKLNDNYVILEEEDFERAAAEKTKRIDISSFVYEAEIDPIYYESTYYLEPESKDEKPYVLLRTAMQKKGVVAMGTFVMRNKEHLCVIKVLGHALVLSKIHFQQEIRSADDYKIPKASAKLSPGETKMAVALIDNMLAPFDISKYKDEYKEQLLKFIKRKAKGQIPSVQKKPAKISNEVSDLLAQLKASLGVAVPQKKTARKAAAPKRTIVKKKRKVA